MVKNAYLACFIVLSMRCLRKSFICFAFCFLLTISAHRLRISNYAKKDSTPRGNMITTPRPLYLGK